MSSTVRTDLKSDDYYQVLGVKKDATEKELTKAYRKAAMKWHPDRHQDEAAKKKAETNFKRIGEAYTVLKDPKTRETYDRFGKAGLQGGGPPPSGSAGGFPGGAPGGGGFQMSQEQAEALFKNLFGGAGGASMSGGGPGNVQFVFTNGGPGGASRKSTSGGNPFGGASMSGGNPFGGASMGGNPFGGASTGGGAFDLSDLLGGLGGLGGMGGGRPGGAKRGSPFGGRSAPASQGPLENRTEVTIHGLKGQPQFNGQPAVVVGYDPSSGRHMVAVACSGGQKTISVKPQNLVQRVRVTVRGLKNGAQHNGKSADVTGMNPSGDRYVCEVGPQRKVMALKPENVTVPSGTRVKISGLKAAPQWNGRWALVESFVGDSKRYRVRVLDGSSKKLDLKPGNVRL